MTNNGRKKKRMKCEKHQSCFRTEGARGPTTVCGGCLVWCRFSPRSTSTTPSFQTSGGTSIFVTTQSYHFWNNFVTTETFFPSLKPDNFAVTCLGKIFTRSILAIATNFWPLQMHRRTQQVTTFVYLKIIRTSSNFVNEDRHFQGLSRVFGEEVPSLKVLSVCSCGLTELFGADFLVSLTGEI